MKSRSSKFLILLLCVIIAVTSIFSVAAARPADEKGGKDGGTVGFKAWVEMTKKALKAQYAGVAVEGPDGPPFKTMADMWDEATDQCIAVAGNPSGAFKPVNIDEAASDAKDGKTHWQELTYSGTGK